MFIVNDDIQTQLYEKSVIIFCSSTCNPCKITVKVLSELEKQGIGIAFFKITVDSNDTSMDVAKSYGVDILPSLAFMEYGTLKHMHSGMIIKSEKFIEICKEVYGNGFKI